MAVSAAFTMDTGMLSSAVIFCACADAHIHCCLSIKWNFTLGSLHLSLVEGVEDEFSCHTSALSIKWLDQAGPEEVVRQLPDQ